MKLHLMCIFMMFSFLPCVFSVVIHSPSWTLPTSEGICHLCTCQEKESQSSRTLKVEFHVQVPEKKEEDIIQMTPEVVVTLTVKHLVISPTCVSYAQSIHFANYAATVLMCNQFQSPSLSCPANARQRL